MTPTLDLKVGGTTLKLREPMISERWKARADNTGTGIGVLLHMIAEVTNQDPHGDVIKSIRIADFKKAEKFFRQFADVQPPALGVPEVTITFEPFTVSGITYREMILREPTVYELDRSQKNAQKAGGVADQELAAMELILAHSGMPRIAFQNLPVTAFDKAVLYYWDFLAQLAKEDSPTSSKQVAP